jgi:hypothetical protein
LRVSRSAPTSYTMDDEFNRREILIGAATVAAATVLPVTSITAGVSNLDEAELRWQDYEHLRDWEASHQFFFGADHARWRQQRKEARIRASKEIGHRMR